MQISSESEELSEAVVGRAEDQLPEVGTAESVTTRRPAIMVVNIKSQH